MKRLAALALVVSCSGCAAPEMPADRLEEALTRLRLAFENGDEDRLAGLYPDGWALVALAGEPQRSVTGEGLRRQLGVLFRRRAPVSWSERPRSIRRSADGRFVILTAEWRSMEIGTDRPLNERFRIALERETGAHPGWRIGEITVWTRR